MHFDLKRMVEEHCRCCNSVRDTETVLERSASTVLLSAQHMKPAMPHEPQQVWRRAHRGSGSYASCQQLRLRAVDGTGD